MVSLLLAHMGSAVEQQLCAGVEAEHCGAGFQAWVGTTALHCAAWKGHEAVLECLLASGVDVSRQHTARRDGWTPLLMACENGEASVLPALIAAGVDVNEPRRSGGAGFTPLMYLCYCDCAEGVALLLRHLSPEGVTVQVRAEDVAPGVEEMVGSTAVLACAMRGAASCLTQLLQHAREQSYVLPLDHARADGLNALHEACRHGHLQLVQLLVKAGATLSVAAVGEGYTAVMMAATFGHAPVLACLIDALADGAAGDVHARVAAEHVAADNAERVGSTALHQASMNGRLQCVEQLLAAGAREDDVLNAARSDGLTALALASYVGAGEVVEALCRAGARLALAGRLQGMSCVDLARQQGHSALVLRLEQHATTLAAPEEVASES